MTTGLWDNDKASPGVAEERGPLRAGKLFVTDGERATIRENLETAHQALTEAWGLWQERDRSEVWEYERRRGASVRPARSRGASAGDGPQTGQQREEHGEVAQGEVQNSTLNVTRSAQIAITSPQLMILSGEGSPNGHRYACRLPVSVS